MLLRQSTEKTAASAAAKEASRRDATRGQNGNGPQRKGQNGLDADPGVPMFPSFGDIANGSLNWGFEAGGNCEPLVDPPGLPFATPDMEFQPRVEAAGATSYELLGLGLFEALPPTEMIEEL